VQRFQKGDKVQINLSEAGKLPKELEKVAYINRTIIDEMLSKLEKKCLTVTDKPARCQVYVIIIDEEGREYELPISYLKKV